MFIAWQASESLRLVFAPGNLIWGVHVSFFLFLSCYPVLVAEWHESEPRDIASIYCIPSSHSIEHCHCQHHHHHHHYHRNGTGTSTGTNKWKLVKSDYHFLNSSAFSFIFMFYLPPLQLLNHQGGPKHKLATCNSRSPCTKYRTE